MKSLRFKRLGRLLGGAVLALALLAAPAAAAEYKEIPGAIKADPDPAISSAWNHFHNSIPDRTNHRSGMQTAQAALRLTSAPTTASWIDTRSENFSYAYHLLRTQIGGNMHHSAIQSEFEKVNRPLMHFVYGVKELYQQDNYDARFEFAQGIFAAAGLNGADLERIRQAGVDIPAQIEQWRKGFYSYNASELQGPAEVLQARVFLGLETAQKEIVLNVGILPKVRGIKPPTGEQWYDPATPEYRLMGLYWNLGFYLLSERGCENEEAYRTLTQKDLYQKLQSKLNFHTASISLL